MSKESWEMWVVVDNEDDTPYVMFQTEDEARGYVALTGGIVQGCTELAILRCNMKFEIITNEKIVITKERI